MSNDYFNASSYQVPRNSIAQSSHVNNPVNAIESAFDYLPSCRTDGTIGFDEVFTIEDPTAENHPVPLSYLRDSSGNYAVAGGTANALTITPTPAITAYSAGMRFLVKISSTNTGAATIAVSGLAAKDILRLNGDALEQYDMMEDSVVDMAYDGTSFRLLSTSSYYQDMASESVPAASSGSLGQIITVGSSGAYVMGNVFSGKNLLVNSDFSMNQALYDAGTSIADGNMMHDMWLAVGSTSYTYYTTPLGADPWDVASVGAITIQSGDIKQKNDDMVAADGQTVTFSVASGGCYISGAGLSGTTTVTAGSPVSWTMDGSEFLVIETGSSFLHPKLEVGSFATPWSIDRGANAQECYRYFYRIYGIDPSYTGLQAALAYGTVIIPPSHTGYGHLIGTFTTPTTMSRGSGNLTLYLYGLRISVLFDVGVWNPITNGSISITDRSEMNNNVLTTEIQTFTYTNLYAEGTPPLPVVAIQALNSDSFWQIYAGY